MQQSEDKSHPPVVPTDAPLTTTTTAKETTPLSTSSSLEWLFNPQDRFPSIREYTDCLFTVLFILHLLLVVIICSLPEWVWNDGTNPNNEPSNIRDIGEAILDFFSVFAEVLSVTWCSIILSVGFSIAALKLFQRCPRSISFIIPFAAGGFLVVAVGLPICVFVVAGWYFYYVLGFCFFVFVGFGSVGLYLAFSLCACYPRVQFSLKVIQTAASIMLQLPSAAVLSYVTLLVQALWLTFWMFTLSQAIEAPAFVIGFLLFSLIWTSQVIKCTLRTAYAGVVASWYFNHPEPHDSLSQSLKRALTSSFGSVCIGSLLTAVFSTIELAISSILPCCVCHFLFRYANRYAFVQVATYGKSYCRSARSTLSLFRHYGFEALANDNLTLISMFSFSSLVVMITALLSLAVFSIFSDVYALIALITVVIGGIMASTTFEVLDSAIVTLFVCFVEFPERLETTQPELYQILKTSFSESFATMCGGSDATV